MSIFDPRLWLAATLWTVSVGLGCYWYGNSTGENSALLAVATEANKALSDRVEENDNLLIQMAANAKKATIDHANEIDAIRRTAASNAGKRVPIRADFCQATGKAESTASGSDGQGSAATAFLPDEFTDSLRQAAALADEITADMRTLVRRTNEAGCFQ